MKKELTPTTTKGDEKMTAAKLATKIVGDGKRPNKWFVTIAYGWHKPYSPDPDEFELKQVDNSLESATILFNDKESAEDFFDNVPMFMPCITDTITGETIGQVILEDRSGTVKEKYLRQRKSGSYFIDKF